MCYREALQKAYEQALVSQQQDGVATGAVLLKGEDIIAQSHDRTRQTNDPIAVAEVDCIKQAGRRNDQLDLVLCSSRYPDMLSAGTILQFSIGKVVVGLPKTDSEALSLLSDKNVVVEFCPHDGCVELSQ